MEIFDPFSADIKGRTTLIEASAGTGKTYTITSLFLRLILEKELLIQQILVVTFTEAAALELKDRILKRLRETLKGFESFRKNKKEEVEDPFVYKLIDSYKDFDKGIEKISTAITCFDLSCIFTIHGFCRKILSEHAFETKNFFESEILSDESLFIRKSCDDFYRQYIDTCTRAEADILLSKKAGPELIAGLVKKYMSYPKFEIVFEKPEKNLDELFQEFFECEKKTAQLWQSEFDEIKEIVSDCRVFKKTICDKFETRKDYLDKIFLTGKNLSSVYTKEKIGNTKNPFWYFTQTEIEKGVRKGQEIPSHIFFEQCETLHAKACEVEEETLKFLSYFKKTGFTQSLKILSNMKEEQKVLGFGDFLFRVKSALENDNGDVFKNALRKKYKAALIDEFQDTDLIQYEIFKIIFKDFAPLFFIGDPKQAIYRFRGADIYAYLNAKKDADYIFTLARNYRSSSQAINAVNAIFSYCENPFGIKEIDFLKIKAAKPESDCLYENKSVSGGADLLFISEKAGKTNDEKNSFILNFLVSEITNLLSKSEKNQLSIGKYELKLSDIAVLVKKNDFGREVRKHLENNNIPCVLTSEESVFETMEAESILEFLDCAANPLNERKIKKVLTGNLFMMSASDLNNLLENESQWGEILNSFKNFERLWTNFSVMEMLNCLYYEHNILNTQARLVSGERRVTNLLHIFEILHEEELRNRHGKKSLTNWLAEKIQNREGLSQEYQLRMESDEKKLKIMTVHKSKGLEFPVVFCAFFPKGRSPGTDSGVLYHDEETKELILDFRAGQNENCVEILKEEETAEDIRAFYVAVTRAKYKTYIFISVDKKKPDNYASRIFGKNEDEIVSAVKSIADSSKGAINFEIYDFADNFKIYDYSRTDKNFEFKRCEFKKDIEKSFQISSFSLVSSKQEKDDERFDSESTENPETANPNPDEYNIFNFPKGAFSGIFFHSVFEDLDFCASDEEIEDLVKLKLEKFGFKNDWLFCVCQMVKNVLNQELEKGLFLKNITNQNKITELEFYYPLEEADISSFLKKLMLLDINKDFKRNLEKLSPDKTKGFMKGFIDLVFSHQNRFYVLDWKSNHLGYSSNDYEFRDLFKEVNDSLYFLQYYIYSYALDKYLKYRLGKNYSFKENFGGVYYLFLRGIESSGSKNGVYYDLPVLPL
jgi:exodeoxyribonuclease V beta subunit